MPRPRRRTTLALQAALAGLVVLAVAWHFRTLLQKHPLDASAVTVRPGPLLLAAVCYLLAHAVWATFFWQLLKSQGTAVTWPAAVRAYFVSQAGKYVPGKAWVILARVVLLRGHGAPAATVAVCGTYETLTSMAAGAGLGVLALPWSGWGLAVGSAEWLAFLALAALPVVLGLSNGLLVKLVRKLKPSAADLPAPPVWLVGVGLVQTAAGWLLLALGLWLTLAGLLPDDAAVTDLDPRGVVAAVCLSYVAGFAALVLPGGVGARELLLQMMLAAQLAAAGVGNAAAVGIVVAVAVRGLWTAAEFAVVLPLWAGGGRAAARADAAEPARELAGVGP